MNCGKKERLGQEGPINIMKEWQVTLIGVLFSQPDGHVYVIEYTRLSNALPVAIPGFTF